MKAEIRVGSTALSHLGPAGRLTTLGRIHLFGRMAASEDSDLREIWCSAARRASDTQLVACVAVAIVVAVSFAVALLIDVRRAFTWWPAVLPPLFAGAFGVWGIADRELEGSTAVAGGTPSSRRALVALRWCSALAAGLVGVLGALGILTLTIGTWIS
jgi:hypothetical protein